MNLDSFVGFMVFRELMLISHQKNIKQLQETLRQELHNDENWREKVMIMWPSSACVLFAFQILCLLARKTIPSRFLCFCAHVCFFLKFPRPNMLMMCVFSKMLDTVMKIKRYEQNLKFCKIKVALCFHVKADFNFLKYLSFFFSIKCL